jgi:extracellular sulfatase Sulf
LSFLLIKFRTPSWNEAPNYDKQYLLKITGKMEPIEQRFTDVLQQKRLQTLQSVDDLVDKVILYVFNQITNISVCYKIHWRSGSDAK